MLITRYTEKEKEVKEIHKEQKRGKEKTERKLLIFLLERGRNTMLSLIDTLTVKDTVKQGELNRVN